MKTVLNIAHRGFCSQYPENTMLSFRKAYELGVDGVETDVQLTKDHVPVIMHDEALDRTTDGKGLLADYTLKELREMDAGIKFGQEYKGLKIPTLDEFLDFYKDKNQLINLELKNSIIHYENLEEIVFSKLKEYSLEKNTIISTFNHYSLVKCRKLQPDIKLGLLYWDCIYRPEIYAATVGVDYLHPEFNSLDSTIVSDAHAAGFGINAYTVDSEKDIEKMISLGIDAVITDCPDVVKRVLGK